MSSKKILHFFNTSVSGFILKHINLHPSLSTSVASDFCCCCWKAFANAAMGLKFLSRRFKGNITNEALELHQTFYHPRQPWYLVFKKKAVKKHASTISIPRIFVKLRTRVGLLLLKHLSWRSHVWMMGVLPKVYFYRSITRPLASDHFSCKIPIPAAHNFEYLPTACSPLPWLSNA